MRRGSSISASCLDLGSPNLEPSGVARPPYEVPAGVAAVELGSGGDLVPAENTAGVAHPPHEAPAGVAAVDLGSGGILELHENTVGCSKEAAACNGVVSRCEEVTACKEALDPTPLPQGFTSRIASPTPFNPENRAEGRSSRTLTTILDEE